jgi:catechol-2,3-dioxygenase
LKINKIDLYIHNFNETIMFYKETLSFTCLSKNEYSATFQIGNSQLVLHKEQDESYFYHFAFNIPSNMFQKAKSWLAEKVSFLTEDGKDQVHFNQRTQAYACYFEDPSGNIVEFIARTETSSASFDAEFSSKHVLSISEINLSTDHVTDYAHKMRKMGIHVRDESPLSLTSLNFMGEYEDGAFILLGPLNRRWFFSSKLSIYSPIIIHTDRGVISTHH